MNGISHLPAFLAAAALIILIPGPATLYVAGQVQHSKARGYAATFGIVVGDLVLITLSGLGFAALVARWPLLLDVIKVGGALYVAWLGLALYNTPPEQLAQSGLAPAAPRPVPTVSPAAPTFARAVLLTLTNPKPILFFAAFFPLFIDKTAPSTMRSFYTLGALFEVLNVLYFVILILLVARLKTLRAPGSRGALPMHKISGCGLLLCAAAVLIS